MAACWAAFSAAAFWAAAYAAAAASAAAYWAWIYFAIAAWYAKILAVAYAEDIWGIFIPPPPNIEFRNASGNKKEAA